MSDAQTQLLNELVTAVVERRDQRAFRRLVDETQGPVYRVAYRMCGNEAEDVVQETYIRAWNSMERFGFQSTLVTWLCRIAINTSVDWLRKKGRRPLLLLENDEMTSMVDLLREESPGPEDELGNAQLQSAVQKVLAELKPKHRLVLSLREIDGLSYGEIAETLGCSQGTVESRIHRARHALQKKLQRLQRDVKG